MERIKTIGVLTGFCFAGWVGGYNVGRYSTHSGNVTIECPSRPVADSRQERRERLIEYTERAVTASAPKISQGKYSVITTMLPQIAGEMFEKQEHREYWIALVGVESRYQSRAKSNVGAVGLGQLLPKYRNEFGKACGLTGFDESDLRDDYTNAYLSACYFKSLIEHADGNIALALTYYNAGLNSWSAKQVKQGAAPVKESGGYVTKVVYKKQKDAKDE